MLILISHQNSSAKQNRRRDTLYIIKLELLNNYLRNGRIEIDNNLLENAIQYTINEKKLVEVNIDNTAKNLNIKVADTGIGIPKGEQKKIFDEFYRASNARVKLQTGSGIGLYACAQYVKAHKGTIKFDSKENEGTTFYITIPLKTEVNINEFMEKI